MIRSVIIGTGSALPARRVSNEELAQEVDTTDEWIVERTGIRFRHIAGPEETTATLATDAAKAAIAAAGVSAQDIDLIVLATATPDQTFPASATKVQAALGIDDCVAFDVAAVCSGFLYAVQVADSMLRSGVQKRALVIWQRIMLPNGSSLRIDNVPATDASGYAGLQDKVEFHTWALLKGVAVATLLGVGSQITVTGDSDLVQAIRESTQQNVSRAGDQLTSRNLNIQPTITIRPGATVRLVVHKDLILAPWRE